MSSEVGKWALYVPTTNKSLSSPLAVRILEWSPPDALVRVDGQTDRLLPTKDIYPRLNALPGDLGPLR